MILNYVYFYCVKYTKIRSIPLANFYLFNHILVIVNVNLFVFLNKNQ